MSITYAKYLKGELGLFMLVLTGVLCVQASEMGEQLEKELSSLADVEAQADSGYNSCSEVLF